MPTIIKKVKRPWIANKEPRIPHGGRKRPNNKFYTSYRWIRLRDSFRAANPLCAECLRNGITKGMDVVDHIVPINQGGDALARENLQSLCHSCHNKKSGRESRG